MIIITGMHRSGTSAIANLLMELGVNMGEKSGLHGADQWNEKGYFEQTDLINLNNRIITGFNRFGNKFGKFMGRMILWVFFPSRQSIECRATKLKGEIAALVDKYSSKGVKDPRFCATLKFWKSMVNVECFVVCLREPAETVRSIKRRQKLPLWFGYRFWNFNMAALLEELCLERTLFIDYNCLLSSNYFDELSLIRKFFQLQLSDEEMAQRYKKVFDPGLYNCKVREGTPLPSETQKLWNQFMGLRQQARKKIKPLSEK